MHPGAGVAKVALLLSKLSFAPGCKNNQQKNPENIPGSLFVLLFLNVEEMILFHFGKKKSLDFDKEFCFQVFDRYPLFSILLM